MSRLIVALIIAALSAGCAIQIKENTGADGSRSTSYSVGWVVVPNAYYDGYAVYYYPSYGYGYYDRHGIWHRPPHSWYPPVPPRHYPYGR